MVYVVRPDRKLRSKAMDWTAAFLRNRDNLRIAFIPTETKGFVREWFNVSNGTGPYVENSMKWQRLIAATLTFLLVPLAILAQYDDAHDPRPSKPSPFRYVIV